jgi:hypothetical protein
VLPTDGFVRAGPIGHRGLNLAAPEPRAGRRRHRYGNGPFARLVMPPIPNLPGVYLWELDETVVYVGRARTTFSSRLGSNGYSTISMYNTLAREIDKAGGQETNCRINSLANAVLDEGQDLILWYRVTDGAESASAAEVEWMAAYGTPQWNRRTERTS